MQTFMMEGAPAVRLQGPAGDVVTVLLRGAQVVSWVDAQGVERLYRSPNSPLAGPQAVRGGVPVIFPQFSERGPLMRHGFARTRVWTLQPTDASVLDPHLVLQMQHAATELSLWPHDCTCTLTVALLPQGLRMALTVHNTGSTTLPFHAALHTYLEVGDITQATLTGVLPQQAGREQFVEELSGPPDHDVVDEQALRGQRHPDRAGRRVVFLDAVGARDGNELLEEGAGLVRRKNVAEGGP